MNRRVVGSLRGTGPKVTSRLQGRVSATDRASAYSDHVPLLIDMNPQAPSRIAQPILHDRPCNLPVINTVDVPADAIQTHRLAREVPQ